MVVVELLNRGGWMMWVILSVSIIATAITLERVVNLYMRSRFNVAKFMVGLKSLIDNQDYKQAMEACNVRTKHPLPQILKAGISKSNRREKEIERAMEEEMLRALPKLQRGIGFLALLGNSSTLLGLLGTIFGLITAFSGVSAASASARQQVLAEGISMAMYTTAFGLIVAVPILFSHQIVSDRVDKIVVQMEEGASGLLGALASRIKDVRPQSMQTPKGEMGQ
ncbi:MAG: MotA/TolQ/ExbB proton channel family protein [Deltaproteobacteria bacterium]|nr:MotA/TolQ/ExbB proton channel family protein [Deltaproteobacteria bacterium]